MIRTNARVLVCAAAALVACGGADNPATIQNVGSAGATLTAGGATLTIPAGALSQPAQLTLREAEPRHQGRVKRIEIEPRGLSLAQPARLSIQVDDANAKVRMHDANDDLVEVEVEDRNHGRYKTRMNQLGEVEVELEHGIACNPACGTGQECDDGVCKAHSEDAGAKACEPVCDSGQECDDGACKPHSEVEPGGGNGTICVPACATGLECDDGVCKPHKG